MAELLRIFELTHRKRPVPRLFRPRLYLDDLRDCDIVSRYRLDRESILYVEELCRDDLVRSTVRGHPIEPITQVLACLRFLAKGDFFSEVGDVHGISKSSMSRIMPQFLNAINTRMDNIRFPRSQVDASKVKLGFYRRCGIPNVLGAVDGTFIPIASPREHEEAYVCRKGFHALNLQAVVDSQMRFLDVVAKWPGATHDAAVFDSCGLKNYLEQTHAGHLLGDSGYPLREYLLTPVLTPSTTAEEKYNRAHSTGRMCVERAFGILKSRFRCLHRSGGCLPFQPGQCAQVACACLRLHNLCQERKVPLLDIVEDDCHDNDVQPQPMAGGAYTTRQSVVNLFQ